MRKTEWVEDAEFERRYPEHYSSAIIVTMEDGTEYSSVVDDPRGNWRNPVTHKDIENKFTDLVKKIITDKGRVEQIIDYVNNLETQASISDLSSLIP